MVFKELYKRFGKNNRTRISNLSFTTLILSLGIMIFGVYQNHTNLSKIDRTHPKAIKVEQLESKVDYYLPLGLGHSVTFREIANDKNILSKLQDYAVGLVREVDSLKTLDDYSTELVAYKSKRDKVTRDTNIPLFIGGGLGIASFIGKAASYKFKN